MEHSMIFLFPFLILSLFHSRTEAEQPPKSVSTSILYQTGTSTFNIDFRNSTSSISNVVAITPNQFSATVFTLSPDSHLDLSQSTFKLSQIPTSPFQLSGILRLSQVFLDTDNCIVQSSLVHVPLGLHQASLIITSSYFSNLQTIFTGSTFLSAGYLQLQSFQSSTIFNVSCISVKRRPSSIDWAFSDVCTLTDTTVSRPPPFPPKLQSSLF